MALIVQKFGGTSVGTPERIHKVAERIAATHASGHQIVVVVSAMGRTTDELIELAGQISQDPPQREMDMLLTAGERISMALLSMALADRNVKAVSFTGSQSGIITSPSHRRARIHRILGDRIRNTISQGKVSIVAGFQGVSEAKEVTTLGRGGSDTTAVALAAALRADCCEIYTDVDGVYSADPGVVPKAKLWKQLPLDLMVELATRGAGVLHPRSVELAKRFQVPLCVKNSLNDHEGTAIMPLDLIKKGMEEFEITGVSSDDGKFLITVDLARPAGLSAVWDLAAQGHLLILSPHYSSCRVQFFTDRECEAEWKKNLAKIQSDGFINHYTLDTETIPVSIGGSRFSQDGLALSGVFEILGKENIQVNFGSGSSLAMTVGIPAPRAEDAVRVLHHEFLERDH